MKTRFYVVLVGLALILTGCGTIHFSQLQGSYQTLRQREASFGSTTSELDRDEVGAAFMAVAQDASELAQSEGDDVTKISILRLAAVSAWRAQDRGGSIALSASTQGRQACEKLSDGSFGAPRDCALLLFVPNLVTRDRLFERVLPAPPNASDPSINAAFVARVRENAAAFASLANASVDGLKAIASDTGAYRGLAPGVMDYLQAQVKSDACQTFAMQDALNAIAARDSANAEIAAEALSDITPAVDTYRADFDRRTC
jgi:hypothetical protein